MDLNNQNDNDVRQFHICMVEKWDEHVHEYEAVSFAAVVPAALRGGREAAAVTGGR
jgi:hypothetical protein